MRHLTKILLAVLCLAAAASCSPCNESNITESKILSLYNEQMHLDMTDVRVYALQTGTYECSDASAREALRRMEAAGLITYDVTRLAWWEKSIQSVKEYYDAPEYYYGYYIGTTTKSRKVKKPVYEFEDHYIVKVALTKKGKSLVTELKPVEEPEDKDMKQPDIDPSKYAWNKADLTENWPDIPNPFVEAQASTPSKTQDVKDNHPQDEPYVPVKDNVERIDSLQYQAYQKFSPEFETVTVKAYRMKATKARNIRLLEFLGIHYATAEVISTVENVTDFGRIVFGMEDGMKFSDTGIYTYYLDKGWVSANEIIEDIKDLDF